MKTSAVVQGRAEPQAFRFALSAGRPGAQRPLLNSHTGRPGRRGYVCGKQEHLVLHPRPCRSGSVR